MEFHDAANIFPMEEETIADLAKDIREHGLQVPIETFQGKIIDGRRRHHACLKAGVKPQFREVSPGDPIAYVLSLNLHRRHLTTSQRAMIAGRAREVYERQAKDRQKDHGGTAPGRKKTLQAKLPEVITPKGKQARDLAGAAVGVGGRTVDYATKVLRNGVPELAQAVDAGEVKVFAAEKIAALPKEEQMPALQESKAKTKPDPEPETEPEPEIGRKSRGKGVALAHQAINLLAQIPKNDALRKDGLQIVAEWCQRNLRKI